MLSFAGINCRQIRIDMLVSGPMKTLLLTFLAFLLSTNLYALALKDLESGDILLLSLKCYECRMIESETSSAFSHSGIVVVDREGKTKIAQALGLLHAAEYKDFVSNITPGTSVHVYRAKELARASSTQKDLTAQLMFEVFERKYKNAPFDSRFLWDNFNSKGEELLYCSEFIAKFIDNFLTKKTTPFPVTYDKNWDYWFKLFKGDVPHGELGNSPASFSRDARFEFIGTL